MSARPWAPTYLVLVNVEPKTNTPKSMDCFMKRFKTKMTKNKTHSFLTDKFLKPASTIPHIPYHRSASNV